MFDMGWSELLLIGIVALIVVGPKDLPVLFRNVGQFVGKARGMAREFTRAMEDAAKESGVDDVTKTLRDAANPKQFGLDKLRDAADLTPKSAKKPAGSNTEKLSKERAEAAEKIRNAAAERATQRKAEEAAAAATPQPDPAPAADTGPKPDPAAPTPTSETPSKTGDA
ncbi:Sec-independent protein translocase protein TatB [Pseudooceanicola nanhaiensis]|uniref:Sec-independent protein translocase protein TatB n=1 Tax=Pseudooceanicola nanhaiensis TaxID=375761 RepID=UPI001CD7E0F8|nr:Sec-independent protein translocase protein TatB [Pseudooceanicola nanhaiensis]MCA0921024.1 Sec-independent protein translocase protein TatB [Pseudooceanicola nanhaiensis]